MKAVSSSLLGLMMFVASLPAQVVPPHSTVAGKTIGEWTAANNQWIWPQPTNQSPDLDTTGSRANNGQSGPVFFVAGGFYSGPQPPRHYSVPEGNYLLIPLIVIQVENIDTDPPLTVPELRDIAADFINTTTELHVSIDGVALTNLFAHREASPVYSFNLLSADNLFTVAYRHPVTGVIDPVVADGYWLMIEPLAPGPHVIVFGGTYGAPISFSYERTDHITVVPDYVMPTNAVVGGKTISEWSAECLKWGFSFSTNQNPQLDSDGRWANNTQPTGNVFYIALQNPFVSTLPVPTVRTFTVPENKYLLLPLLPAAAENIDTDPPLTIPELYDLLDEVVRDPVEFHASIDGLPVPNLIQYRTRSPVFSVNLPNSDNIMTLSYGHPIEGLIDPIVADGYWLMLQPLPLGNHVIRFGATMRLPNTSPHEIIANITVVPRGRSFIYGPRITTNGLVKITLAGEPGLTNIIQVSSNLVNWLSIKTNSSVNSPFEFLDPDTVTFKPRFYRTVSPQ